MGASSLDALQVWYGGDPTPKMGGGVWQGHWHFNTPDIQYPKDKYPDDQNVTKNLFDITSIKCVSSQQIDQFILRFADGVEWMKGGNATNGPQEVRVPDDHYLSSINVISKYNDHDRGWLYGDLVRTMYFGFRLKPDALSLNLHGRPAPR